MECSLYRYDLLERDKWATLNRSASLDILEVVDWLHLQGPFDMARLNTRIINTCVYNGCDVCKRCGGIAGAFTAFFSSFSVW